MRLVAYFSTASYLKGKLKRTQELALRHNVEYLRSLENPSEIKLPSPQSLYKRDIIRSDFQIPKKQHQLATNVSNVKLQQSDVHSSYVDNENGAHNVGFIVDENDDIIKNEENFLLSLKPELQGELRSIQFDSIGKISVSHGDVFLHDADCLLIPMCPNMLPYRGLGLQVFERGGQNLVKEAMYSAKVKIQERIKILQDSKFEIIEKGSQEAYENMFREAQHLMLGDVVLTAAHGVAKHISLIGFVIMPYFWQGSTLEACCRLRYAYKAALKYITNFPISSVCLSNISNGIYGYRPDISCDIFMEETVDALLQVEETIPNYTLQDVHFLDTNEESAKSFEMALERIGRLYLPSMQVLPAPVYWSRKNRQILEIMPQIINFCKKHQKFSFKKYHSIIRRRNQHWFSNLRPYVWRTSRCLEPPPLLLEKETGEVANYQFKSRPYYYRGVSHFLFPPKNKKNFPVLRVSRHGKFIGVNEMPNISVAVKPKL